MLDFLASSGRRARNLLAVLGCAVLLAACGGSDDAPAAAAGGGSTASISGTAASGAPLAGITITVKDSLGATRTTTTGGSGTFTIDTTGLTGPFVLKASLTGSGTPLYSVSADSSLTSTVNITPLSDLVIRSWYNLQGISVDANFTAATGAAPPTPAQVLSIAQSVLDILQLAINNNGAAITSPAELISKPFTADHTGVDKLLDNLRVTLSGATVTLVATGGGTTQTTVVTYNTATTAITASSTTVNSSGTATSSSTSVVPVQSAQSQALTDIQANMDSFAAVINSKGTSLTATDFVSFFNPALLNQGLNRTQTVANLINEFKSGQKVSLKARVVRSLNTTNGTAEVETVITETLGTQTSTEINNFLFQKSGSSWLFGGDGRVASISLFAEGRNNQGSFTGGAGPAINVDARPLAGVMSSVNVAGNRLNGTLTRNGTDTSDGGVTRDVFFLTSSVLSSPLPAAGTPYVVTLNRTSGGSVSYTFALNSFTTELIRITNLTGSTIADANLGQARTVTWTLPTTYALARVRLSVLVFDAPSGNGGNQCGEISPFTGTSTTSVSVTIPAVCPDGSGKAVKGVNINLNTTGVNGERSSTIYMYQ